MDVVTVLLWVQQLLLNLMEWGKAVCGYIKMIMSDSSSYSCQFCSPYGVDYTRTIRFNQVGVAWAGVDPCPNNCLTFLDMPATIRVGPGFPVRNLRCESQLGMMGEGGHFIQNMSVGAPGSLHFVWVHFSNFLIPGAVSACLALHIGWLAMLLGCQFASGMSQARYCSHVG